MYYSIDFCECGHKHGRANATFVNNAMCDDVYANKPDNGDPYAMTAQIDDPA